jgi:hypothetical protein
MQVRVVLVKIQRYNQTTGRASKSIYPLNETSKGITRIGTYGLCATYIQRTFSMGLETKKKNADFLSVRTILLKSNDNVIIANVWPVKKLGTFSFPKLPRKVVTKKASVIFAIFV